MSSHSTELWARAQMVIPGGVNSPVRSFRGVGGTPVFFKQGRGPYLIDADDRQYIDYVCSWGPVILGHAHPLVFEAVIEAAKTGLGFGAPTHREVEMAECLTKLMPSMEQVRLVNSGTEATQTVIRLARGATQRDKILKFEGCYHGHVDSLLVKAGSGQLTLGLPDSPGIPEDVTQHTLTAPFNDLDAVHKIFKTYGHQLAAVIVEPIAANMNLVLPQPEFLPTLRKYCTEYGSLLIFDEVITGFRVALGGAQALYNVSPDLTCLGKVIGGGLPVGAFGGRRDIMAHLAPLGAVYQAGTLSGNPLAVAAGLANLKALMHHKDQNYQMLERITTKLTQGLSAIAAEYNIPLQTRAIAGLFGLFFTEEKDIMNYAAVARCHLLHFKKFFHGMLERGVYLAPSAFEAGFVSLAHTDFVIEKTLATAEEVFKTLSNEKQGFQTTRQAPLLSD